LRQLMHREFAAMLFGDPPYNVRIGATVAAERSNTANFSSAPAKCPRSVHRFPHQMDEAGGALSEDGSIHYVCIDWRHLTEMLAAGSEVYSELKNVVVWNKTNAGQGSFYRSQHEFIFVFKNGDGPHQNNVELGKHGRNRSNVWTYPGVNTFRTNRMDELSLHPT